MLARLSSFVTLAITIASLAEASPSVVDRSVHRKLQSAATVDVIVRMKPAANVLERFHEADYSDRTARITALKNELTTVHASALKPLVELGAKESSSSLQIKPFWIAPLAAVKGATLADIERIAALPNVESIREARAYPLPKIKKSGRMLKANARQWYQNDAGTAWGVWKINAPAVWATGNTGQGIRVASMDSGVFIDHEALKKNFAGEYSWYDPELKTSVPHDDAGHGSHTMGTIAGAFDIGVAPGAKWMACRGCRVENCPDEDLLECAQFLLCPTKTDGSSPDCSKAPHVINNSWSGFPNEEFFVEAAAAWVKAGIIPVFAAGNEGLCETSNSPGDFPNVISVGSTTIDDALSSFSSKGPTWDGRIKPDLSAPGEDVLSSFDAFKDYYALNSGTSMATPHVTGAIALLLHAEPTLTLEQVRARLTSTAVQTGLQPEFSNCGNTTTSVWPNNMYGHGRLDIYSAIQGKRVPTPQQPPAPTQAPLDTFSTPPPDRFP